MLVGMEKQYRNYSIGSKLLQFASRVDWIVPYGIIVKMNLAHILQLLSI